MKCEFCEFVTSDKRYLNIHMRKINQEKLFICNECDYSAVFASKLRSHKESKHDGIVHKCDRCGFITPNKSYLKCHKDSANVYPCDECEYTASNTQTYSWESNI